MRHTNNEANHPTLSVHSIVSKMNLNKHTNTKQKHKKKGSKNTKFGKIKKHTRVSQNSCCAILCCWATPVEVLQNEGKLTRVSRERRGKSVMKVREKRERREPHLMRKKEEMRLQNEGKVWQQWGKRVTTVREKRERRETHLQNEGKVTRASKERREKY